MKKIKNNLPILLADDEENFLYSFRLSLEMADYKTIFTATNADDVRKILEKHEVQILFLDLNMPGTSGLELLPWLRQNYPDIQILILTAVDDTETAVTCMKEGAYDYIIKPVNRSRVLLTLEKLMEHMRIREEISTLQKAYFNQELKNEACFAEILTRSQKMRSIFNYAEAIADSPQPVLITGETGVGKELMARAIYCCAKMKGPFVSINIAGLDDASFNDSLFGHRKGAFTGADVNRDGLLKNAAGGAILLDEIGELNESSQVKLLRLLNDGSYYPLGSDKLHKSDVRFIFATNRDLEEQVRKGKFRKDLYYRLISHRIYIPPLRERKEDIGYLVREMLQQAQQMLNKRVFLSGKAMSLFSDHDYPGNVRELKNIVFDCVANTSLNENISIDYLQGKFQNGESDLPPSPAINVRSTSPPMTLAEAEKELIRKALRRNSGNQSRAAEELGISRQALNKKIHKDPDFFEI